MSQQIDQPIGGNVAAGTHIGRDQIVVVSDYADADLDQLLPQLQEVLGRGRADLCADIAREQLTVTAPGAPSITLSAAAARDLLPAAARRADERAYLAALLVNPRYGRWAGQFVPLTDTFTTFERSPGWGDVLPAFTLLGMYGEGAPCQVRQVRLDDITQAITQHGTLLLLGEPGAGKTTVLYKLALDAARQRLTTGEGRLPLYLTLADYRDYASPFAFLNAVGRQLLGGDVAGYLRQGDLLLLCDALDEMPFRDGRDYRERLEAWRRFVGEWPGNQVLFACRNRGYGDPLDLRQVEIQRLDDERVREFLGKYLAADLAQAAWEQLAHNPLLDQVRNPYRLSMLIRIVASDGVWPASRATLFQGFVDYLLAREEASSHPDWPGKGPLWDALSLLAETLQPLGQGTRQPRQEVLARIPAQVDGPDGLVDTSPPAVLRLGLAAALLDTGPSPGSEEQIWFCHHQLQEYLAARALLARFQAGEDLADRWRQPRLAKEMPDPGYLGDYEPLPPPPTTGWEEPTILAADLAPDPGTFVEAVRQVNPVLATRCLVEVGLASLPETVQATQADLLREMGDRRVHLRARIAAGLALGRLSDPRFQELTVRGQRVLLPPFIHVPAGPFRMGSWTRRALVITQRRVALTARESPRHTVDLPEFYISRFPVTNAEYACFIAAGGYWEERYWPTTAALAWLRGEAEGGSALEDAMGVWRAVKAEPSLPTQARRTGWSPQVEADWKRLGQMDETEVRELLRNQYADRPRDCPAFWDDERYNNPVQPVVGVNWFEAQAYCHWLADMMRSAREACRIPVWRAEQRETCDLSPATCTVRLPTEAEWEKAARRDRGWQYPWGNHWDLARGNTWEGHVLRPTPVGVYPDGITPEGVHDLAGNVWEWTSTLYRDYPYRPDDGREDPETEGRRVLRGGSWSGEQNRSRLARRSTDVADDFTANMGLRVVVSLT